MTVDLVAFLRARLDEDEQIAEAVLGAPWVRRQDVAGVHTDDATANRPKGSAVADCRRVPGGYERGVALAEYIVRNQPARVIAEVEAKWRLIKRGGPFCTSGCDDPDSPPMDPDTDWTTPLEHHFDCGAYAAAELLALPYASHPDYRDEWQP